MAHKSGRHSRVDAAADPAAARTLAGTVLEHARKSLQRATAMLQNVAGVQAAEGNAEVREADVGASKEGGEAAATDGHDDADAVAVDVTESRVHRGFRIARSVVPYLAQVHDVIPWDVDEQRPTLILFLGSEKAERS